MEAVDFRAEILARRAKLMEQVRACDVLLAGLEAAEPATTPTAAVRHGGPPADIPQPAPAAGASAKSTPAAAASPPGPPHPTRRRRGWLSLRVKQAAEDCRDPFTVNDVLEAYKARFGWGKGTVGWDRRTTEDRIASTLWKVAKNEGYRVAWKGAGRRPTVYSKAASSAAEAATLAPNRADPVQHRPATAPNSPPSGQLGA